MTITLFPADAVGTAPDQQPKYSGRKLRQADVSVAAVLGSTTRPLGARSGIRAGTPDSVFSIAGTTWSVGAHNGTIDAAAAGEAGAYNYANDAPVTGEIVAASASIIRWDGVFGTLVDPAESAGTGIPRLEFTYVAGTAALTMPATPARSFPLMRIIVPVNGTGSATAVAVAPFTASAGGVVPFRSIAERDAWAAPESTVGQVGKRLFVSTGTGWVGTGPRRLGSNRSSAAVTLAASPSWSDLLTFTGESAGGLCVADVKMQVFDGNSGVNRSASIRVLCDGVQVGDFVSIDVLFTGGQVGDMFAFDWESTPAAGSHTWVLQARASAAPSVRVSNRVLTVTEN